MSKSSAETALALFNRTNGRGDVLSIHLEDGAKLAALPKDMFTEIMFPLFQWWVHGMDIEPSDPRDKMVFDGMKAHQTENAIKRGISLKKWQENAVKGGRPKSAKKPSGNQAETKRIQLEETSIKTEDARSKSSVLNTCDSVAEAGRDELTPPVRSALSVDEAKKILAMDAPEISSHAELKTANGKPSALCSKLINANEDAMMLIIAQKLHGDDLDAYADSEWIEELNSIRDGEAYFDEADLPTAFYTTNGGKFIKSLQSQLDDYFAAYEASYDEHITVFKRALLCGYLSSVKESAKNPEAWIIARLKKVLDAIKVIAVNKK